ncbi:C alpha chain-like [Nothobranchius furzeri]|uniref:C alpha chain-like n=2 Tax=Nothobranchius furzeri TaxID=105023 RepID=A0A9D2YJA5_NOTFU|nr:C alpha chain-like [Nothobranchius furzeri]
MYPAASHLEGTSPLMCLASDMFPPLVRFSWRRQKEDGPLEDLSPDDGEQLELRESGRSAAILLVPNSTYKYSCSMQHEGWAVESRRLIRVSPASAPVPHLRHRLVLLLFSALIVRSLVFCSGISLMIIIRKKELSTSSSNI